MTERILNTPLLEKDIRDLSVGDVVYISGTIFTARDMAHKRIKEFIESGQQLPVDFNGSVIFHAGPVVRKISEEKWELLVVGPTTSIRMEPYWSIVSNIGARAIIGKGGLAEDSLNEFVNFGQVYLQAAPGCAVVLAEGVKEVNGVHWLDMGVPEALWSLKVQKFGPLVVGMDSLGNSIYADLKEKATRIISDLYPIQ